MAAQGAAGETRRLGERGAAAACAGSGGGGAEPMALDTSGDVEKSAVDATATPPPQYPHYPVPPDEDGRLHLLRNLNVLDVSIERLDPLVREAARLFATPISAISVVDVGRQWFVAKKGLDVNETERAAAFCGHAIMPQATIPFIVPDTHRDPRFRENPLVTGPPYIRFYCGMPIYLGGIKLGTLCVIDDRTRTFQRADFVRVVNALGQLSRLISKMLVRRAATGHPAQANVVSAHPRSISDAGSSADSSAVHIGSHMTTTLDVPLSSVDVGSPLYRAFGLNGKTESGLGEAADCWLNFDDADFATMIGQLLQLVESSYVHVVAAGCGGSEEQAAQVAERRKQKGDRMVSKFAQLWDRLGCDHGPITNAPHLGLQDLMSSSSLFMKLAPRVVAWSQANDTASASKAAHALVRGGSE